MVEGYDGTNTNDVHHICITSDIHFQNGIIHITNI